MSEHTLTIVANTHQGRVTLSVALWRGGLPVGALLLDDIGSSRASEVADARDMIAILARRADAIAVIAMHDETMAALRAHDLASPIERLRRTRPNLPQVVWWTEAAHTHERLRSAKEDSDE